LIIGQERPFGVIFCPNIGKVSKISSINLQKKQLNTNQYL